MSQRLLAGRDISKELLGFFLVWYFLIAAVVFFQWGIPSLNGEIIAELYSDSVTYEEAAKALGSEAELVSIAGNYLGPTIMLKAFDFNRVAIFLCNVFVVFLGVWTAVRRLGLSRAGIIFFLLPSPLLFFSLIGVNKEVFLLPLVVYLVCYIRGEGVRWMIFALITSVFVRWQLTVFVLMIWSLSFPPMRYLRRSWIVIGLLLLISFTYPTLAESVLGQLEAISLEGAEEEEGAAGGLYPFMQGIQRSYGYFLVVVPKTLQLLVGYLTRISFSDLDVNFWNGVVIMGQCLHNLVLLVALVKTGRWRRFNDYSYLVLLFAIFFAVTPIFAPRYLLPISFLMAFWLADNARSPKAVPVTAARIAA